jgi:hypothetical protein
MAKVTLLSSVIILKILLFNGCAGKDDVNRLGSREEIRYENKLDSLYERKIDSAYKQIGQACDSTLGAKWKIISDSIIQKHHELDSLKAVGATGTTGTSSATGTTGTGDTKHPGPKPGS